MPGGLRQALPATRQSTRGGVLEYLLAVSCAGLCQRCNCRVDACPLSDLVVVNFLLLVNCVKITNVLMVNLQERQMVLNVLVKIDGLANIVPYAARMILGQIHA